MPRDQRSVPGTEAPPTTARRVRLLLRDQHLLDGVVHLPGCTDLATFLATREGGWVNLTDVRWAATGGRAEHLVLKTGVVLWAGAAADEEPLLPRPGHVAPRPVRLTLENRVTLHGELRLLTRRRLSDVLAASGAFFPVCDARVAENGIAFGDVAVNRDAVHAVEDLAPRRPAGASTPLERDVTSSYLAGRAVRVVDPGRPVTLADARPAAAEAERRSWE